MADAPGSTEQGPQGGSGLSLTLKTRAGGPTATAQAPQRHGNASVLKELLKPSAQTETSEHLRGQSSRALSRRAKPKACANRAQLKRLRTLVA